MTVPPPPGLGPHGAWSPPPAGGAWPPPAGMGSGYPGYPEPGYPPPGAHPDAAYAVYPPGAYPGPGYPPSPKPGTNGFAIAALVFGIIGGALLGFIFGFIALSQAKRTGQNGRGLALAGIILSAMWTVVAILAVVLVLTTTAKRDDTGTVTQSGDISATALKAGDCLNGLQNSVDVSSLPGVPCTQPHQGEVFAVFDLPAGPYPGAAAVDDQVSKECNARIVDYSPGAAQNPDVGLFSVYPLEQNWAGGDREVVCIATAKAGTTTGSIKGR